MSQLNHSEFAKISHFESENLRKILGSGMAPSQKFSKGDSFWLHHCHSKGASPQSAVAT